MSTLAIDNNCDLIIENGSLVLRTGPDELVQKLTVSLQFWLGEWFLDTRQGFPGYEIVYVKNPDLNRIRLLYRQLIQNTPGVDFIEELTLNLDNPSRTLSVTTRIKAVGVDEVLDFTREFILI